MSFPASIELAFTVEPKLARPGLMRQMHGVTIVEVEDPDHQRRLLSDPPEADACFTRAAGLRLHVFTADCLPVLLASSDPQGPVAAIHCGWRGAAAGIVGKTLERLSGWQDSLHAVLGPSLRACCFEVRSDLVDAFTRAGHDIGPYLDRRHGRMYFRMDAFVIATQLSALRPEHLHLEHSRCTYCSPPPLPSYRRNKGTDPRICSWIMKRAG